MEEFNAQIENLMEEIVKEKKKKRFFAILFVVLAVFLLSFCLLYFFFFSKPNSEEEEESEPVFHETTEESSIDTAPLTSVLSDDEMRGVFIASVSNINFPSRTGLSEKDLKAELDEIVVTSRKAGFDTIYFQVRPTGDALYQSSVFPTSRFLSGKEGDALSFDPLTYIIEKAASFDMEVVAWVNPYRITNQKEKTKEEALETLCESNPAKKHPEWTVFYDGKLYYDPARPEVRELISSGVKEICENYEVAGVLYDDYFYPYKVKGETFDDAASYETYGGDFTLEDWRRDNVNQMVKLSYETVKGVSDALTFGVSPFGIWKNASSDPSGSDTSGMEAYYETYCDATAWIAGEYVDYLAPQIYWERGHSAADFATLTRWWSAQVDGTKVKLYVAHAAYKVADFDLGADEITQQITYARSYMGVAGSIQYGYADIAGNTDGLFDALAAFYESPYHEETVETGVSGVSFSYPYNGIKTEYSSQFVSCISDPNYPVTSAYGKVGRTKSGFFSIQMALAEGDNYLTLQQNGKEYSIRVVKTNASTKAKTLSSFSIQSVTPADKEGAYVLSGETIPVTLTAPIGCRVIAKLNGEEVQLKETLRPAGTSPLRKEVYAGELPVPAVKDGDTPISFGNLTFTCEKDGKTLSAKGAEVFVVSETCTLFAKVTCDYTHLKVEEDSSFYDDYTPTTIGMTSPVKWVLNDMIRLSFGGYIAREEAELFVDSAVQTPILSKISSSANEKKTSFSFDLNGAPALDCKVSKNLLDFTLFETALKEEMTPSIPKGDHLFRSCKVKADGENAKITFELKDAANYYGFSYCYEEGKLILSFNQPQTLEKGDLPLNGKTVVLDAGHGGTDNGASGFVTTRNEDDLNLSVTLALASRLEDLGAAVILSRDEDETLSLNDRMDLLIEKNPDFSVSIHHNSINESKNANAARGTLGLYWAPSGISLAEKVSEKVASSLGYYYVGAKSQELALCRNYRFPQTLVEVGFMCSPAEYQNAMRSDYAEKAVDGIVEGILDWYRLQEKFIQEG